MLVLLLFVLRWLAGACEVIYYVKPVNDDACPRSRQDYDCYPLMHYVQSASYYFTSDTTFEFLSGDHILDLEGPIMVQDVKNLSLRSAKESEARILCTTASGLAFLNVTDLHVAALVFIHCGAEVTADVWNLTFSLYARHDIFEVYQRSQGVQAAIFMVQSYNLMMSDISVENSTGYGLLAINVLGDSVVKDSSFLFNNFHILTNDTCKQFNSKVVYSCQGGNAAFVYVDLAECTKSMGRESLKLLSCTFQFGADVITLNNEETNPGGAGVGILGGPVSYAIEITLVNVTCSDNIVRGPAGINFHIVLYEAFQFQGSYSIIIDNSRFVDAMGIHPGRVPKESQAFWYGYFLLGVTPENVHCPFMRSSKHQSGLNITHSRFSGNTGGIGMHVWLWPRYCLDSFHRITLKECVFENNMYSALVITEETEKTSDSDCQSYFSIMVQDTKFSKNAQLSPLTKQVATPYWSVVILAAIGNITFLDSEFTNNTGTAIEAYDSEIHFQGETMIYGNTAMYGGGLGLRGHSYVYLRPEAYVYIINNHAIRRGGGIHYSNIYSIYGSAELLCFFRLEEVYYIHVEEYTFNMGFILVNNTAVETGSAVYGGLVDDCGVQLDVFEGNSSLLFEALFTISEPPNSMVSAIASTPTDICFCRESKLSTCHTQVYSELVSVFPGAEFRIQVILLGQRQGTVPGVIHSALEGNTGHLNHLQDAQQLTTGCQNLTYTVYSHKQEEVLYGSLESADVVLGSDSYFRLIVHLQVCPTGFTFSNQSLACECAPILAERNLTCNIDDETVKLRDSIWIGVLHGKTSNKSVIMFHEHCPFDYCNTKVVKLNLDNGDEQCAFNRSGILCGACMPGLSLALGTSQCLKCSSAYVAQAALFALAGIAVVIILIALNLTVSVGTINGLIFYANIVRVNHAIFFPPNGAGHLSVLKTVLTIFIAWLNLDLGIETCFADGLDTYTRTWLQFIFPIYIWIIVGILIYLSRHYNTAVKLFGRNIISVLATLFLLSYAKLQRTIIAAFSFTYLQYEDDSSTAVWLYDGNVVFLQGKHLALVSVAFAFGVLFIIPFTLLLVLTPCLLAKSGHFALKWVNNIMPLLDAYQGPYKDTFRFWTGLMLVIRIVLFSTFAVNTLGDPHINLLVIQTVVICLLTLTWQFGSVYKKRTINVLESFFVLNLGLLATWSLFQMGNQSLVTCVMVGTVLGVFFLIIAYHVFLQFRTLIIPKCCKKRAPPPANVEEIANASFGSQNDPVAGRPPTVTYIDLAELREPLLTD